MSHFGFNTGKGIIYNQGGDPNRKVVHGPSQCPTYYLVGAEQEQEEQEEQEEESPSRTRSGGGDHGLGSRLPYR